MDATVPPADLHSTNSIGRLNAAPAIFSVVDDCHQSRGINDLLFI